MTTLILKTTPPFCHKWQRASNSSNHLVVTGRAINLILIIIIVVQVTIIVRVLKCLWKRKGRHHEATKASLLLGWTIDTGVHLTQLITECVKASIHALKLRHNRLEIHTTRWWRRSGCRRSRRSWRSCRLSPWPFRSKLGLALSNGSSVYGTHSKKVCRLRIGDRKMVENPRDSWRENKLIMGRRIPIDICRESMKWKVISIVNPSSWYIKKKKKKK